ncbi:hypothetical protein F2P81_017209 [Scophthalmus maximus]|uniref:Uncharacterized protein n=1 Tax=Scophthalmus maximus TaxID=52904 RepID=A0A6A4SDZ9_SCOMX|nr:hypothetical protein F2P81_017209 [Scophthalmus maximus]
MADRPLGPEQQVPCQRGLSSGPDQQSPALAKNQKKAVDRRKLTTASSCRLSARHKTRQRRRHGHETTCRRVLVVATPANITVTFGVRAKLWNILKMQLTRRHVSSVVRDSFRCFTAIDVSIVAAVSQHHVQCWHGRRA